MTSSLPVAPLLAAALVPAQSDPAPPVGRRPVRVLYIEGSPTWEYRHLTRVLTRSPGIEARTWLASADRGWVQPHSPGCDPLQQLPRSLRELRSFDVILIGDVLVPESVAWCANLCSFARGGGGLGFLAGERHWVDFVQQGGAQLLPVAVDVQRMSLVVRLGRGHARLHTVQPAGELHPILRVGRTPAQSSAFWKDARIRVALPLRALEKHATVLLEHESPGSRPGPRSLAITGVLGTGRTFLLASDETWLWRAHGAPEHRRFWENVVSFLAQRL